MLKNLPTAAFQEQTVGTDSNYEIEPNSEVAVFVLGVICIIKQSFAQCNQPSTKALVNGFCRRLCQKFNSLLIY